MARRYTTKAQDRAFIDSVFEDATRAWKPGDLARSFRNGYDVPPSAVVSIEGDIVTLADGSQGHVTRMRRPR